MANRIEDLLEPGERVVHREPSGWNRRLFWPFLLSSPVYAGVLALGFLRLDAPILFGMAGMVIACLAIGLVVTFSADDRSRESLITDRRVLHKTRREGQETVTEIPAVQQTFTDLILNIIPENPFQALAEGQVLPIIFFCILFGYFVTQLDEPYKSQLGNFFQASFQAMMKLTRMVVWSAPLGVFGINAKIVATTGFEAFRSLGFYFVVVLIGLFIHATITLPLFVYAITRKNPFRHYRGMPPALVTAFSTCSTIVTLPLTMKAVTETSRVSKKIASFVLPIGATVNMDGTALYECVAVIFIAQVYGFELTFAMQLVIVVTALLASIGAASVPMSGMVMMSIILGAVGLPLEGVGIILAVDRILDMFRTTVNVLSDSVGSVVVASLEGEQVLSTAEQSQS